MYFQTEEELRKTDARRWALKDKAKILLSRNNYTRIKIQSTQKNE